MQRILWPRHYEEGEWFEFDLAEGAKEKKGKKRRLEMSDGEK